MPVVAIAGAVGSAVAGLSTVGVIGAAAGTAVSLTSMIVGGLQIAGGVLGAVGAFTGNKKLAKIGAIAGLAGFAGAALTGAGGLFGGEAAAESATGFGAVDPAAAGGAFGAGPFDTAAPGMPTFGSPAAEALSTPVAASAPLVQNNSLLSSAPSSFKPTSVPVTNAAAAPSQPGLLGAMDKWATENPTLAKIISGGVTKLGEGLAADSKLEEEMKRQKELALYKQQLTSSGLINSRPLVRTGY